MAATVLIGLVSAAVSGLVTFLLVRRRESGNVGSSTADDLWRVLSDRLAATEHLLQLEREEHDQERQREQRLRHDLRNELHVCRLKLVEARRKLNGG